VGERLLRTVAPRLDEIESELANLTELRGKPAGTIRITAGEHAPMTVLQAGLTRLLPECPDIKVEIIARLRIGGHRRRGLRRRRPPGRAGHQRHDRGAHRPRRPHGGVGSPDHFPNHARTENPQDLTRHNCINVRLPTHGGLFPSEFEKEGREIKVRVGGQLVFNNRLETALAGLGLAYLPEDHARAQLAKRRLIPVLEDSGTPFPGYLYYPTHRHASRPFAVPLFASLWRHLSGRAH
jgi:DNA-binding transcriptional LysR family regulator